MAGPTARPPHLIVTPLAPLSAATPKMTIVTPSEPLEPALPSPGSHSVRVQQIIIGTGWVFYAVLLALMFWPRG